MNNNKQLERYRYFLKDYLRLETDFSTTDQNRGKPPPPVEKEINPDSRVISLPSPDEGDGVHNKGIIEAIKNRKSHRRFSKKPLSLKQLSFLLWATQGVRQIKGSTVLRNVPSAGNRHPLETYICALNITGLVPGIYLYRPLEHELRVVNTAEPENLATEIELATLGQAFIGTAAVVLIWTAVCYRTEWRYGKASHKVIALDAGHACQSLYLAVSAIGGGTCAIAAYNQDLANQLIGVDGKEEFVIYLAPVGLIDKQET
ncbi:MAG: SagB/ThcOx family dehydrogenase [Actinomycetia bacterium]|nr:SagB/ThcOx family dehydrogenase [Actinomycetes bacterium]